MNTKIGEVRGFAMFYDTINKRFILNNADGEQVGEGGTQDEVEAQAEKLAKTKFPFPIPALRISQLELHTGKVTSLNIDDKCAWFVYNVKAGYRNREKVYLDGGKIFELTELNKKIVEEVAKEHARIEEIKGEIVLLFKRLEKNIDLKYFGLP